MKNGYTLRIELDRIKPPIWRRFEIPPDVTIGELHYIVQAVMGWYNSHMHSFEIAGEVYWDKEFDEFDEYIDEDSVTVSKVFGNRIKKFKYIYDFGDSWVHTVKVEKECETRIKAPRVLKGKRACPPEDCGGPWGYEDFLKVALDPNHERHNEIMDWIGEDFDPEHFDVEEFNEVLKDANKAVEDNVE